MIVLFLVIYGYLYNARTEWFFGGKKQQISSILREQIQNENCNYICLNQTKIYKITGNTY